MNHEPGCELTEYPDCAGKKAVVFEGPLILVMPIVGLHTELDQPKDKATSQFTMVTTSKSSKYHEPVCE